MDCLSTLFGAIDSCIKYFYPDKPLSFSHDKIDDIIVKEIAKHLKYSDIANLSRTCNKLSNIIQPVLKDKKPVFSEQNINKISRKLATLDGYYFEINKDRVDRITLYIKEKDSKINFTRKNKPENYSFTICKFLDSSQVPERTLKIIKNRFSINAEPNFFLPYYINFRENSRFQVILDTTTPIREDYQLVINKMVKLINNKLTHHIPFKYNDHTGNFDN